MRDGPRPPQGVARTPALLLLDLLDRPEVTKMAAGASLRHRRMIALDEINRGAPVQRACREHLPALHAASFAASGHACRGWHGPARRELPNHLRAILAAGFRPFIELARGGRRERRTASRVDVPEWLAEGQETPQERNVPCCRAQPDLHHEASRFAPTLEKRRRGRPHHVSAARRNRVVLHDAIPARVHAKVGLPVYQAVGLPGHHQMRVLVCSGSRLLSWLGAVRPEPFGPARHGRRSAAALEVVLDALRRPAFVVGPTGAIDFVNRAGVDLLRRDPQGVLSSRMNSTMAARPPRVVAHRQRAGHGPPIHAL